jgi:hypothetical protein
VTKSFTAYDVLGAQAVVAPEAVEENIGIKLIRRTAIKPKAANLLEKGFFPFFKKNITSSLLQFLIKAFGTNYLLCKIVRVTTL